jgi:hypothetical protein
MKALPSILFCLCFLKLASSAQETPAQIGAASPKATVLSSSPLTDLPPGGTTTFSYICSTPGSFTQSTSEADGGAGHLHNNPGRPGGTVSPTTVVVPCDGQWHAGSTYTAPPVAGVTNIDFFFNGAYTNRFSLNIRVAGLIHLPPSPYIKPVSFSGIAESVLLNPPHDHPDNHWAKQELIDKTLVLAKSFFFRRNKQLVVNDMSLPWGGTLDFTNTWTPPHATHRDGRHVDIQKNGAMNLDDQVIFRYLAEQLFGKGHVCIDGGTHWHLVIETTCTDTPVAEMELTYAFAKQQPHSKHIAASEAELMKNRKSTQWAQVAKLTSDKPSNGEQFGAELALSGGNLAVSWNRPGQEKVRTYHYSSSSWKKEADIERPDPPLPVNFAGDNIAMDKETLVVGARSIAKRHFGMVFVFIKSVQDKWLLSQTLSGTNAEEGFGVDVAVQGDTLVVGIQGQLLLQGRRQAPGAIEVFQRTGSGLFQRTSRIEQPDSEMRGFGENISLYGDGITTNVGPQDAASGVSHTFVLIFRRIGTDWVQEDSVQPRLNGMQAWPGISSLYENTLAVSSGVVLSAPRGIVLFTRGQDGWVQSAQVLSHQPDVTKDSFGGLRRTVKLDKDKLFVGAYTESNASGKPAGAVYIFAKEQSTSTWSEIASLRGKDLGENDWFGYQLAVDSGNLAVSALNHGGPRDCNGLPCMRGAVYLFKERRSK